MTTSEARKSLPALARAAAKRSRPSEGLLDNAIEIHPRGEERSAYLVPAVDLEAAQQRIADLEDELEDIAWMRLLEQRVQEGERLAPVEDVIRDLGFDDLLQEAPAEGAHS